MRIRRASAAERTAGMSERINVTGTDLHVVRESAEKLWDVVNDHGEIVSTLPGTYTAREVTLFCAGYDAGHRAGMPAGFQTGYEAGRRIMRGDVLKALGVYDSMRELQAQTRILADIAKVEETK